MVNQVSKTRFSHMHLDLNVLNVLHKLLCDLSYQNLLTYKPLMFAKAKSLMLSQLSNFNNKLYIWCEFYQQNHVSTSKQNKKVCENEGDGSYYTKINISTVT